MQNLVEREALRGERLHPAGLPRGDAQQLRRDGFVTRLNHQGPEEHPAEQEHDDEGQADDAEHGRA
jgi:hypothetical protein